MIFYLAWDICSGVCDIKKCFFKMCIWFSLMEFLFVLITFVKWKLGSPIIVVVTWFECLPCFFFVHQTCLFICLFYCECLWCSVDFILFGVPSPIVMLILWDYLLLKSFAPINFSTFQLHYCYGNKGKFWCLYKKTLLCDVMVRFCR